MDEVMANVEPDLANHQTYDSTWQGLNIGMDFGPGYSIRTIDYIRSVGLYYNAEYQGYNENGIQFGKYPGGSGLDKDYITLYHK